MRTIFLIVCILCASIVTAQKADLSPQSKKALETLKHVDSFALGGVGFAARTSEGELALRVLMKDPAAKPSLLALSKDKNMAARLYGLLGTRLVSPKAVPGKEKIKTQFKGTVRYFTGCLLTEKQDAVELALKIVNGDFDAQMKETSKDDTGK